MLFPCAAAQQLRMTKLESVDTIHVDDTEWNRADGKVKHFHINTVLDVGFWDGLNSDVEILAICQDTDDLDIKQPIAPIMCWNLRVLIVGSGMHLSSTFVRCLPFQLSELYAGGAVMDEKGVDFSSMGCLTHLSLSDCGITRIGRFVFPTRVFYMDLSHNMIDLGKLRIKGKIIGLSLGHCALLYLSRWVIPISLEELDLSGTGILHIHQLPPLPRGLRKLNLSGNELEDMGGWAPNVWLEVLDIGNNKFSDFPVIAVNQHLTTLVFDNNAITDGDIYRLYTMMLRNANGSHLFKIIASPIGISAAGCRLSKTSEVIKDAAAELSERNEGNKKLDGYLHTITCLTMIRCAASIPNNAPVRAFPLDLCKCLKKYLFKQ